MKINSSTFFIYLNFPDAIPYVTSYYKENWGFCMTHNQFISLPKSGTYKVVIDSELEDGSINLWTSGFKRRN
jgi:aminopeptidase-like protein